ncbi:MAG: hypothetical protein IJS44_06370 [Clostridia bacterium]|nr:hypothetical protein [Clostridia bacterium]
MENTNMTKCQACGQEIAKTATACPACGAKVKKPIFKKWWFWVIVGVVVLSAISAASGNKKATPTSQNQAETAPQVQAAAPSVTTAATAQMTESKVIEYTPYDCIALFDELAKNALRAEQAHQDEYVEVTGYIHGFDSDGKYFTVGARENDYDHLFDSITCYFKNDTQRETAIQMDKYDKITIRGKITSIGEVLGYRIDVDEIIK